MCNVKIYGKEKWPYTKTAREAYTEKKVPFKYIDVLQYPAMLDEMLKLSDGVRKVPVIVESGKITVGFNGGSWQI